MGSNRIKPRWLDRESTLAYLLILPSTVVLVALMFYPVAYVFVMSVFKTTKLAGLVEFVGLKNFAELLSTRDFWILFLRTLLWTVLGVVGHLIFGLIFAVLLNSEFRGRKIARMVLIIPWAAAVPISSMIWRWVFDPEFGLLNHTLRATGLWTSPPIWLGAPVSAFISVLWVDVWIGIPFVALVFLAGMQAISKDLYESADIDGANASQKFRLITIPCIRHIIIIATLLTALWTFNDFIVIYILTKGGPAGRTDILITAIYRSGFEWLRFDRASTMSVITFVILTVLSIVYARLYFKGESST